MDAKDYNLLSFAFVGDSVHTLFVRTHLTLNSTAQPGKLHLLANNFVKADAQAKVLDKLELTEEEQNLVRRARNTKSKSVAKNAKLVDYKKATAFEVLIGFLYLTGQIGRMNSILSLTVQIMEQEWN